MLPLHSFIYSISCLVKKCMNYDGVCKFCYEKKKLLKKQRVYWNKKLSTVYYYSEKLYKQMTMYFRSN